MALYAFDGTWNVKDRKDPLGSPPPPKYGPNRSAARDTTETNVHRFCEFYGLKRCHYRQGVGTRFWWLGRLLGGAFGAGGKRRVRWMYRKLLQSYADGDEKIDIVGFSRGAAMAVHFANVVRKRGIRDPNGKRDKFIWWNRELGFTFRLPKVVIVETPQIDSLGLWDTVATFGFPIGPLRNKSLTWDFDTVPTNVIGCFHAKALDEVRNVFELVHVASELGNTKEGRSHVYSVWFRGVHSNIGGGMVDRGLSDISLAWMMEQVEWMWTRLGRESPPRFSEALSMLELGDYDFEHAGQPDSWEGTGLETLEPDPNGTLGRPFDVKRGASRNLGETPIVHMSVRERDENLLEDHYSTANRILLRRLPKSVQWTYDPPTSFPGRRRYASAEMALSAFSLIPFNPREWLKIGRSYVFRSDDWVGIGPRESRHDKSRREGHIRRRDFVRVALAWILADKPVDGVTLAVNLPDPLPALNGRPQPVPEMKQWVVAALTRVDRLRPWWSWVGSRGP